MSARTGYPTSFGNRRATVMTVAGPTSYAQYTAPSTGGQVIQVEPNGGVKSVDWAQGAVSNDGLHRAEVVQVEASDLRGVELGRTAIRVKFYVVATGAQVAALADLSTKTFDYFVLGDQ